MRRFSQVDVFTDQFMLGNPVAVVHDADGLTDDQLAAFARWTNLSETTFLLPPTDPAADYRLRIFTTARELPFAGHPTLGSARAWLAAGGIASRGAGAAEIVQECAAGLIRIRREGGRLAFAAPPLLRSGPLSEDELATVSRALRIDRADIIDAAWADNGPGWVAVLLTDAAAVLAVRPDASAFGALRDIGVVGPHPSGSDIAFEVRAFIATPGGSLVEDPVTGSLNASIAQWLIGTGRAPTSYLAAQGTVVGRQGRIRVEQRDGEFWVGGDTVVGITGTVEL